MKLNKLKYSFIASLILSSIFIGCLKDDAYNNKEIQSVSPSGAQKAIYIGLTATSNSNHLQLAFEKSPNDTTFDAIPVLIGGDPVSQDIQVTLSLDAALLGSYNDANGTAHEEAPTSLYTIINAGDSVKGYTVTIPKGSNVGYLQLKLKPNDFLGFDYALGVKITGVPSGYLISSNYNTGILAIGVKNEFDGVYSYKGYALRAGDASLTGYFSGKEMQLITAGATSLKFGSLAYWGDGNSQISIGTIFLAGLGATSGAPYSINVNSDGGGIPLPGYNEKYDPATKTFYIGLTWGAGPAARQSIDTLTYLRPR